MTDTLLILALILLLIIAAVLVLLFLKKTSPDSSATFDHALANALERSERGIREEISKNRLEASTTASQNRQEIASTLQTFAASLDKLTAASETKLAAMRETIELRLTSIQQTSAQKLDQTRDQSTAAAQKAREEVALALQAFDQSTTKNLADLATSQRTQLAAVVEQLAKLTISSEQKIESLKSVIDLRLKAIQEDNTKSLDQMRATVDEKLQGTLEKRLGESFKIVSERLEQVHKGLGEMQSLATGVGDLKKVLGNVKSRGTYGEVQLGTLLEEVLTPDQFARNVSTKDSAERVEFAIKLPGHGIDRDEVVWLPIDAKFPLEDYQRLVEAQERADPAAAESAAKALEDRIKKSAQDICDKYINPPRTTHFAILFLPTEGLFAEVVRRIGLTQHIQQKSRVIIAGPTTLWSVLNSLQMGFQTLVIQKRSSEVWNLLAAVKTEFSKYGDVLAKVQKKLHAASETITSAAKNTRAIERRLTAVQQLPIPGAQGILMLEPPIETEKNDP